MRNFRELFKNGLFKACCLCLAGLLAVGITVYSVGITFGFKVDYSGSFIATIRNANVFNEAKTIVADHLKDKKTFSEIRKPGFRLTLTVADRFDSPTTVADAIIENTDGIVSAYALVVNGEKVAYCKTDLKDYLETARTRFDIAGAENVSTYLDQISVDKGYYLEKDISDFSEVQNIIDGLEIRTVSLLATEYSVPFESETVNSSEQYIGYKKVTTAGKEGKNLKTEKIEYVNGIETGREQISDDVVEAPVTQITTVGTAVSTVSEDLHAAESGAGFICPLDRGVFKVSAYYGDGRGHKGVDLAAPYGTPIFAAASGTVISAGWDGNYGNCVVVDHGNGYKTRYAHASALKVSVGTVVNQGDLLALVGSTGQSTGNHLHFEVMINGNRTNPAPYIGIN